MVHVLRSDAFSVTRPEGVSLILMTIFDRRKFSAQVVSEAWKKEKHEPSADGCFLMSVAFLRCSCLGVLGRCSGGCNRTPECWRKLFFGFGKVFRMPE